MWKSLHWIRRCKASGNTHVPGTYLDRLRWSQESRAAILRVSVSGELLQAVIISACEHRGESSFFLGHSNTSRGSLATVSIK